MSKQIYCMGQKLGELQKPSSRKYRCLLTAVYAKSSDPLARHYQQQHPVRENKPDPSGGRNQEEAMEATILANKTNYEYNRTASVNEIVEKKIFFAELPSSLSISVNSVEL
ncbi:unnamed protein product [Schistosoma mattheei]|uniref:Uncharacterized protein n=1 Tax=Schistosoma mattheei TaxID=31246 RepID=A0A183PGG2_9TREM|nr:unnamed protein product [Schistosoma mattheei]